MADRYIIATGGTGAMCARAFLYLLAAGCGDTMDTYHILLVDKDKHSDAGTACENLLEEYNSLRAQLTDAQSFHMPKVELEKWNFTDAVIDEYVCRTGRQAQDLSSLNLKNLLNPENDSMKALLMDTLYTRDEMQVDLENGFYGHPNVGAAVFDYIRDRFLSQRTIDREGSEKINQFMTDLHNSLRSQPTFVYLFGSLFGGTGASVFPNVVSALRSIRGETPGDNWGETRLVLGGTMVMPYFRLPDCPADSIERLESVVPNDSKFAEQTREALRYYAESHLLQQMMNLMLVGTKQLDVTSELYARGGDQCQHFHMVLQIAAATALRFFRGELGGMQSQYPAGQSVTPAGKLLLWKVQPDKGGSKNGWSTLTVSELGLEKEYRKMDQFLRFSMIVVYYLQNKFSKETASLRDEIEVLGTMKQMRDQNGSPLQLYKGRISTQDINTYYKEPIGKASAFCKKFLQYYFDVAMSGYDWSKYHDKQSVPVQRGGSQTVSCKKYSVLPAVSSQAMEETFLSRRWVDIVNLAQLHRILEVMHPNEVEKATTLNQIMTFMPLDTERHLVQEVNFPHNIGQIYVDHVLDSLDLVRKRFGGVKNDGVHFSQIYDKIYHYCDIANR